MFGYKVFFKILDKYQSFTKYYFAFWFLKAYECLDVTNFVVLETVALSKLIWHYQPNDGTCSYRQSVSGNGIDAEQQAWLPFRLPGHVADDAEHMCCLSPLAASCGHGLTRTASTCNHHHPLCSGDLTRRRPPCPPVVVRGPSRSIGSINYCPSLSCAEPWLMAWPDSNSYIQIQGASSHFT